MGVQWSGLLSSQSQLAAVIQGESSSPAGQFGVASVMYNRMIDPTGAGGFVGAGSNDITQVVTPTQFNGYNSNTSPYANQLASDLWNGNAPTGGNPGNATFFAAPSSSNAAWANPSTASGQGLFSNGANLGGNYFSDTQGPPSSNFQAPSYGSSSPSVGSNLPDAGAVTPDTNSDIAQQSPSLDQIYANNAQYGVNYIAPTAGGAGSLPTSNGFDQSSLNSGGATSPDASGNGAVNTQALNAPTSVSDYSNPSMPIAAETPDAATPATQAGSANVAGTWDATGSAAVSAAGSAVAKSDASAASSITSALGGAVKSLTSALNSTSQAAAKTAVQNDQSIQNTGTGWINTLLLNTKDLFQRGMIGFFGLILLLGAALYFAKASANERTA